MAQGNIILLNGTSSSGKTAIAKALQEIMDDFYIHSGLDHYLERIPRKMNVVSDGRNPAAAEGFLWIFPNGDNIVSEIRNGPAAYRLLSGMYHAAAALARTGNHVILDDVIFDPRVLKEAVQTLAEFDVLFVGVRCPLDIAQQRERERGDRTLGLVRADYDLVHAHGLYDLEVDTSILSPAECANVIKDRLLNGPPPDALRRLRRIQSEERSKTDLP
jgi:chloramphenicol 3-O phosphotransferase